MARERFEMIVCTEEGCRSLGHSTNEEKAAKRVDREVKKLARRITGRPRRGTVKGSVVDQGGLVRYRAHEEYGAPEPKSRPRRRREQEPQPAITGEE